VRSMSCAIMRVLADIISLTTILPLAATQKARYTPSGDQAPVLWTPCNATAEAWYCCITTDICLERSYCYTHHDGTGPSHHISRMTRGELTDESCRHNLCPHYCSNIMFYHHSALVVCTNECRRLVIKRTKAAP
jgi:hypothetical protein